MAYSCAIFPQPNSTLDEASVAKFERICRKLDLQPDDHLLEIGTGWGGFALYAAQHYGCRVTTTTISRKQYEYTRQQVDAAGLADRVTVLHEDYRDLPGLLRQAGFDRNDRGRGTSVLRHVFPRLLAATQDRMALMLLQAIVIPDQRFDRYRRSVDFIQRYIFPGGCLPSVGAICGSLGRATDLQLVHLEDITPHYAETLALWRQRFRANLEQVRELGILGRVHPHVGVLLLLLRRRLSRTRHRQLAVGPDETRWIVWERRISPSGEQVVRHEPLVPFAVGEQLCAGHEEHPPPLQLSSGLVIAKRGREELQQVPRCSSHLDSQASSVRA